jgi:hypothetical protein
MAGLVPAIYTSTVPRNRARGQGQAPGFADIVVAATAQRHGLTILSGNIR